MFATPRNGKGMPGIVEATQGLKFCGRRENSASRLRYKKICILLHHWYYSNVLKRIYDGNVVVCSQKMKEMKTGFTF